MSVVAQVRSAEDLGVIVASIRTMHGLSQRQLAERLKVSQRQLAERLKVSQRYLSELELGRPKVADARYFAVPAALGISLRAEISGG